MIEKGTSNGWKLRIERFGLYILILSLKLTLDAFLLPMGVFSLGLHSKGFLNANHPKQ